MTSRDPDCRECRELLGGFVLGALSAQDEATVRRHLATCAACAPEHERLARLPALLDLAGGAEPTAAPPPELDDAVLEAFRAERRPTPVPGHGTGGRRERGRARHPTPRWPGWRTRARFALPLAALVVAAFAVITGSGLLAGGREVSFAPAPPAQGSGGATLVNRREGTSVALRLEGLRPTTGTEVYELWFVGPGGRVSGGTFLVPAEGEVDTQLTSAGAPGRYARIGVTREPDGSDPARNGPTVLTGLVSD